MKKKALIIGALPQPFQGPWVNLDSDEWDVRMQHDYGDKVTVEHEGSSRARAVILDSVPGVPHVSVWLEAKNAKRSRNTTG